MKHLKKFTMAALLAFPLSGLAAETSATLYKKPTVAVAPNTPSILNEVGST